MIVPLGLTVTEPLAGSVTEPGVIVNVSPSGSKSLAKTTTLTGFPASVVTASLLATTSLLSKEGFFSTSIVTVAVSQA